MVRMQHFETVSEAQNFYLRGQNNPTLHEKCAQLPELVCVSGSPHGSEHVGSPHDNNHPLSVTALCYPVPRISHNVETVVFLGPPHIFQ